MRITMIAVSVLLTGITATPAVAELQLIPRVQYSRKDVSFSSGTKQFRPRFQSLDLAMTAAYGRFYTTVNYDDSIGNQIIFDRSLNGSGVPEDQVISFNRVDWGINAGYALWRGFTLFGGYRYGGNDGVLFSNALSITGDPSATGDINFSMLLETRGPFLGTAYGIRFRDKGTLGMSLAYADMRSKITLKNANARQFITADSRGFSYGLTWSGPFSGDINYAVGLKFNRYKFLGQSEFAFFDVHRIMFIGLNKTF